MRFSCMTSRSVYVDFCYIYVFQWSRECFFFRHTELNSRFIAMTIDEVTLDRPKAFQRHLLCLLVETLPIRLEVLHSDFHSSRSVPALEWVLGIRSLFLTVLLYHPLLGIWIHLLFCDINTSFALILWGLSVFHLSVCATAPRIFTNFYPSQVRILFCTDKIESIDHQDLVPRQRPGDSLDSSSSLRTLWSAVIESPNFSARGRASPVRLLQESLCYFVSQADVAISVFRKVRINTVLPWFCHHFYRIFQVWFPRIDSRIGHGGR